MLITGWGDLSAFTNATWLAASDPVMIVLIACQVELFFAWRLWIIGRQRWIVILICFFSITELLCGIGTGIAVMWVKEYALFPSFKVIAILWTVTGAVADVFIAFGMTYYLRRVKGNYDATDKLLDRVILRESTPISAIKIQPSFPPVTLQNGLLMTVAFAIHLALYLFVVRTSLFCVVHVKVAYHDS